MTTTRETAEAIALPLLALAGGLALFGLFIWLDGYDPLQAWSLLFMGAFAEGTTPVLVLVALSIWIFVEAYGRLSDPPDVLGGWMLAVALVGGDAEPDRVVDHPHDLAVDLVLREGVDEVLAQLLRAGAAG